MPEYLLSAPCLDLGEQEVEVQWRWSLRNPSPIWSCRGRRWGWLSQGNLPSPSWKGDLLVTLFGIPAPWWVSPKCIGAGLLGVHSTHRVWSSDEDPPQADAVHDWQGCQAPLGDDMHSFPTWVRIIMGWVGFSLFFWGWRLEFWKVSSHCYNIYLDMGFWRDHSPNGNGLFSATPLP